VARSRLQAQGKRVAAVTVSMTLRRCSSDVGIAISTGTDVAGEAGDVALVRSARATCQRSSIEQGHLSQDDPELWGRRLQHVAILRRYGFAAWGSCCNLRLGQLMSLSTVVVAINALLCWRCGPHEHDSGTPVTRAGLHSTLARPPSRARPFVQH
jgi:hypothetical protein